ncbi:MAG TPA: histidine kinase dimerization/phosphoacceptor domain -containing protein, partial [Saprospiraceae bacterium]|nr:histidine kinase dimerization/phosphoacceptor domain -containing protein [Saprospiraceae bacterium]
LLYFLAVPLIGKAQNEKLDILRKSLSLDAHDTVKYKTYQEIIKTSLYSYVDTASIYAQAYLKLAQKNNDTLQIARSNNFNGMVAYVKGDINTALQFYLKAVKSFEVLDQKLFNGMTLNNIAACYQFRKNPEETILYYERALDIFKALKNETWIANVSHNLAKEYKAIKNLARATELSDLALKSFRKLEDTASIALSMTLKGTLLMEKNQYEEALQWFKASNLLIDKNLDPIALAINYENMGASYLSMKEDKQAKKFLNEAMTIFSSHQSLEHELSTLLVLKDLYSQTRDFKNAFYTSEQISVLEDSIFNATKDQNLLDAIKKYELDKKEQEIKLLNTQNQLKDVIISKNKERFLLYFISLSLISILAFTLWWLFRTKNKNNLELERKNSDLNRALVTNESLLKEVHHRVKNNLQIVSSLLNLQAKNAATENIAAALREGQNRIKTMSLIHQKLYQTNDVTTINMNPFLQDLIQNIANSFSSQQNQVNLKYTIDDVFLETDTAVPIALILNELISNAFKYAFKDKMIGNIEAAFTNDGKNVEMMVADDGSGLPPNFDLTTSGGIGLKLIHSFIDKLDGTLLLENKNGLIIRMKFPL